MKRWLLGGILLALWAGAQQNKPASVEIIRDRWGIPHIYAEREADAFFGAGYTAAEDRLLQMDLVRRRARGRLSEVFGKDTLASDRKFRVAQVGRYCTEAAATVPEETRTILRAYAAGVNAYMARNPDRVARRFARLGAMPGQWTDADCICAWMGVAEVFDRFYDESAVASYREFQQLAATLGEEEALKQRGMVLDDAAAVAPESEMAKDAAVYARLKTKAPTPGWWFRSLPDDMLRFSHAWAVDGTRSVTGKPLLESDPQTSVNNPPLWYEFHVSAGRFDVRGISVAGSPGMLVGFNRQLAWGASALGASSTVTFLEKPAPGGDGYVFQDQVLPYERTTDGIEVKGSALALEILLRTRHGFVFNSLASGVQAGEVLVSHNRQFEDKRTSIEGMLGMMRASNWPEFRAAMEQYYSPGLHIVYADTSGNVGYQTLVHVPLTRRTPRMALEGWTGRDEVQGSIPLDEMPHMLNPESHFVSHANNLPVGSWYPHDLGIGTGGTGHSTRSLRLVQLLTGSQKYSVNGFESDVHRDDVHANVAILYPLARRVAEETGTRDPALTNLLEQLKSWDLHYRADRATYPAAMALAGAMLTPYRRSQLNPKLGGGEGGISHLARLMKAQYGEGAATPSDSEVRNYLMSWLQTAASDLGQMRPPADGDSREFHTMPYQQNGPLQFPPVDRRLDLTSPALACGQVGTIWSQKGNSYTQIVDLADVDGSRTVLPPGISEDAESAHHLDQMDIWVRGTTHPAPLSRQRVQEIAVSTETLTVQDYLAPSPRLLSMDGTGRGLAAAVVLRIKADGTAAYEAVARVEGTTGISVPVPVSLGQATDQVFLVLFATGARDRSSMAAVTVSVGGLGSEILYAGPQGSYAGLDQINVRLSPRLAGRGQVTIALMVNGQTSNTVTLLIG
jgi:penicillin G amidase